jgi:hypothetical protein
MVFPLQHPSQHPTQHPAPASAWFGPLVNEWDLTDMLSFLGANNGVAVLAWPRDSRHLERLDAVGIPRLALVSDTADPPLRGLLQDWIRVSAGDQDIHRRLVRLSRAAARRRVQAGPPVMEPDGRLHVGAHSIELPGWLADLANTLVSRFDEPVPESDLFDTIPPDLRSRPRLAGRVARLSALVGALGLETIPIGDDAYVLRWSPAIVGRAAPPPLRVVA